MAVIPTYTDASLTGRQRAGRDCVGCGVALNPRAVIDLGQRMDRIDGQLVSWFPRACPPCGPRYS